MKRILPVVLLFASLSMVAQTYEIKDTVITTYAFSDPDPVPEPDGIYPYYKFETFGFEPVRKTWKMIVLENDYLRVKIFPEIGGKIWSIYDKKQGKEMFYDNKVVKFREISLRGPWTSGGIEFNYGVIGHAPSCSFPVDYKVEKKEDGSVSCYIGVQEMLTRTRWMVEINLPADAVWVRTSSFWHNYSGAFQPYYSWANSGVDASEDLELIYPGTYTIAHDGQTSPYPVDEQGRDLSIYSEQKFGLDKSFHPGGTHKSYFGAYWADDDFGMLHYSLRDEKLGRKYFSWTQSGQGEIWVDLLTDTNPQYVELQSGRLFNQNLLESISTPFKQILFTPYGTDIWNEYWLPFSEIGGVDDMTLSAVVNVEIGEEAVEVAVYPVKDLKGKMNIEDGKGNILASADVDMKASEADKFRFNVPSDSELKYITVDGRRIWSSDLQNIDRPHKINGDFSLESAQGQMIYGYYLIGMRKFAMAEQKIDRALELDPSLIPALNLKAMLCARCQKYEQAYDFASKALAIDTYNPEANYISGIVALKLGKIYDAMDRFEVASITNELRSASCLQLSKIYFREGDYELAADYANKSLVGNMYNISALEILYQIEPDESLLSKISDYDPLCHFPDVERMLAGKITAQELDASIKEEMKWQNYLEIACFYNGLGLKEKAVKVLEASMDRNILIGLWLSYLKNEPASIEEAESQTIDRVFPFREESLVPLQWAVENGGTWKSRYLLAMLQDFLGNKATALGLLSEDDSDYPPYYAYRCTLSADKDDMAKAVSMDPKQWRYRQALAQMYYREGNYDKAIELTGKYYEAHRENFHVGDTYVKSLIADGQYEKADKVLCGMQILPFEGQSGSHVMYRDIKLHLAVYCIDKGRYRDALKRLEESREWPSNLGVGKPYENLIDNKLEDFLTAVVYRRMGNEEKADFYLTRLKEKYGDERLEKAFHDAVTRGEKGYPAVSPMIGNLDASFDKKLF